MFNFSFKLDKKKFNDAENFTRNFYLNLKKQVATDIERAAIEAEQQLRVNAHVITGNMRSSVGHEKIAENSYSVYVGVDYAVFENARGGDHAFFDKAVTTIENKYPNIVITNIDKVFKKG